MEVLAYTYLSARQGKRVRNRTAVVTEHDRILSLLGEAELLDHIADAFTRAGARNAIEGRRDSARNLQRVGRDHRIRAMLARGRAAGLLGHELPEGET